MTHKLYFILLVLILNSSVAFSRTFDFRFSHCYTDSSKPQNDKDSLYCSDGPVIVYDSGKIINYRIIPDGNSFKSLQQIIEKSGKLYCFVDEIQQSFSFRLKDTIIADNSVYDLPDKMIIVSDIEGNFKGFQSILKGAGVIDTGFNWTFGNGHLVFVGDIFDRSPNVTECLWLLYKLETESVQKGGKVHFVLGNHEVMNLKKDYRYVRQKYFVNADSLKLDYSKWYDRNTELGRWIRSKNCIVRIGDMIFVHGGISKDFPYTEYSLDGINSCFRDRIDAELTKDGIRNDVFIGRNSPIWYRGIADGKMGQNDLDKVLSTFGANKMVIGHTIFDEIKYLYGRKVIAIDLEHRINTENGFMNALWFEGNEFFTVNDRGIKTLLK
ncbi:MAG: metallophosphoesterase [Ignavibacteriota bacterium]